MVVGSKRNSKWNNDLNLDGKAQYAANNALARVENGRLYEPVTQFCVLIPRVSSLLTDESLFWVSAGLALGLAEFQQA